MDKMITVLLVLLACWLPNVELYPEQAIWNVQIDNLGVADNGMLIRRSLFENSSINVMVSCSEDIQLTVTYALAVSDCANGFLGLSQESTELGSKAVIGDITKFSCHHHGEASIFSAGPLKAWNESIYEFKLDFEKIDKPNISVTVSVIMQSSHGYLSTMDWPLLPFYGTMCVIYSMYGLVWMFFCFYYWRDVLRVQLWIGAVIILGLIEKAVFVAEYDSVNKTGISVRGAVIAAEMVSCLKRSLCRMLVIIVSLGFGIVKPTLGKTLHQISAVGILYFILCSAEAIIRSTNSKSEVSVIKMVTLIPLALIDSIICWWIFVAIVQTIRTLFVRRNIVKLTLYRQFRTTLIFAIIASVIFAIWSFRTFRANACLTSWKLLWLDDAFWHMLFSTLLLVIMFLWRPSANNQRYAYSPLHDVDPDDDDDAAHENLGDVKKVRNLRNSSVGGSHRDKTDSIDENLRWIDENIPSVLDRTLPALLDDDDESLKRHQQELSKME